MKEIRWMKQIKFYGVLFLCIAMLSACGEKEADSQVEFGTSMNDVVGESESESSETASEPEVKEEGETKPEPEPIPEPVITTITISAVGDVTLGTNQKHSYSKSFHEYYDKYGKEYFFQKVKLRRYFYRIR